MKTLGKIMTASSALLLAGCFQPAGSLNNQNAFAGATANNIMAQSVTRNGVEYLQAMSARFRAEVPTMINFEFNSAELGEEARNILRAQADWIKANPIVRFRVYGHTDRVGSNSYNQALGLRRARAAVRYLISIGVPRNRLEAYTSLGETQPLVNTELRERLNRRTVTDVTGFAPGFDAADFDGKRAVIVYGEYVGDTGSEIVTDTSL